MPSFSAANRASPVQVRRPAQVWWGVIPLLIAMLTGLLLSWHSLSDLDIWFHLRSGRDLLAGQGIGEVNRYSFTEPDHLWVNHEWMFQILAALTGPGNSVATGTDAEIDVSGWNLLRAALTMILLMVILLGDGGWARCRGRDGPGAAAWQSAPVLAGLMLLWPRLTIRPELISYVFLVFLIRWTEQCFRLSPPQASPIADEVRPVQAGWLSLLDPRRPGGRLFLLTVIWAQFHGFVVLAPLAVLAGAVLGPTQERCFPKNQTPGPGHSFWKMAAPLVILVLVALILTPNGWNGLRMPLRAVEQFSQTEVDLRTTISELVPLQKSPNSLGLTITLFRAGLIWGILWILATWGRVSLLRILIFILAAWAAWTNQRSLGIFAVSFMLLHTGAGSDPWRLRLPSRWRYPPSLVKAATGLILTLLVAGVLWPRIIGDDLYLSEGVGRRFGTGLTPAHFPAESVQALAGFQAPRVFANLDAAAFLLANTSGQVFIDGRTEAYSAGQWAEYLAIKRADENALDLLANSRVQAVCLATAGSSFDPLAIRLLNSADWELSVAEGGGLLFRPQSSSPGPGRESRSKENQRVLNQAGIKSLGEAARGTLARRADTCLAAGQLFKFAGNDEKLEEAYRKGLTFKNDHPTLNHNLGNLLLDQQKFQEAVPFFQAALDKNPRQAGSAVNLGVSQMRLGRFDEAARSFRRATAIDPDRFDAWVNLSGALFRIGHRPGAIKALERALEIRPHDRQLSQRLREWKSGTRN